LERQLRDASKLGLLLIGEFSTLSHLSASLAPVHAFPTLTNRIDVVPMSNWLPSTSSLNTDGFLSAL